MPNYLMHCDECQNEFSVYQSIKADALTTCEVCGKQGIYRVIQSPALLIRAEPKTVGMLADRNTSAMTSMQRSEFYEKEALNKYNAKKAAVEELRERRAREGIKSTIEDPEKPHF